MASISRQYLFLCYIDLPSATEEVSVSYNLSIKIQSINHNYAGLRL